MGLIESLRPLWLRGGRVKEALVGLEALLADERHSPIPPAVWVGAVTLRAILGAWVGVPMGLDQTQQALAVARQLDDPALITRPSSRAEGSHTSAPRTPDPSSPRRLIGPAASDQWSLCQIFGYQRRPSSPVNRSRRARRPKRA